MISKKTEKNDYDWKPRWKKRGESRSLLRENEPTFFSHSRPPLAKLLKKKCILSFYSILSGTKLSNPAAKTRGKKKSCLNLLAGERTTLSFSNHTLSPRKVTLCDILEIESVTKTTSRSRFSPAAGSLTLFLTHFRTHTHAGEEEQIISFSPFPRHLLIK